MRTRFTASAQKGFTLVELSIVLVILGLLVGGVLTGQSLIHAAELRSVSTEYSKYQTAINTFKDKYLALPGDMPNAVRYWGQMAGGTADGYDMACDNFRAAGTPSTGTKTCNGDGDGNIRDLEVISAWQHLANGGLIEGTYSGVMGSQGGANTAKRGFNIPASKFPQASWSFYQNGYWGWPDRVINSAMCIGKEIDDGYCSATEVMKVEDAYNIDMKMDDGKPSTGSVVAGLTNGCYVSNNYAANGQYNLGNQAIACMLLVGAR